MLNRKHPSSVFLTGFEAAGSPRAERWQDIRPIGQIFRGAIRQLLFAPSGALIVLSSLGVLKFDPDSLELLSHWLPEEAIEMMRVSGEQYLLCIHDKVYLLPWGAALGTPLIHHENEIKDLAVNDNRIAIPIKAGVVLFDHAGHECQRFTFSEKIQKDCGGRFHADRVFMSSDASYVGAYQAGNLNSIWNTQSGELLIESGSFISDSYQFTPNDRLLTRHRKKLTIWKVTHELSDQKELSFRKEYDGIFGGGRFAVVNKWGGHQILDPTSLEVISEVDGRYGHYGKVPRKTIAALSSTHVAVYAESYGVLFITKEDTQVMKDWNSSFEQMGLDRSGDRIVVRSKWRDSAFLTSISQKTVQQINPSSLGSVALSSDGTQLITASGCGGPMSVHLSSFEVEDRQEEPILSHKILDCVQKTTSFQNDLYAICSYKLSGHGYVGIYQLGKKRAVAKLNYQKESPRSFAINKSGTEICIKWDSVTIRHDLLKKGRIVETLTQKIYAIAYGGDGFFAYNYFESSKDLICLHTPSHTLELDVPKSKGWELPSLIFSEDDSLLFMGRSGGEIHIWDTGTGTLLVTKPLHLGPIVSLDVKGGLLWSLGQDGLVRAFGIPGESRHMEVHESQSDIVLEAPEEIKIPMTRPWVIAGLGAVDLKLGSRTLIAKIVEGKLKLFDKTGKLVKGLRKQKSDDLTLFEQAKTLWQALKSQASISITQQLNTALSSALRTGRTATLEELEYMLANDEAKAVLQNSIWETKDESSRGYINGTDFVHLNSEIWKPASGTRLRLLHPVRLNAQQRDAWSQCCLTASQLQRPVISKQKDSKQKDSKQKDSKREVQPVRTHWAKTPNKKILSLLQQHGFIYNSESGYGSCASELHAPELGAIAVVNLDEEHGCSTLTFHPWNGSADADPAMEISLVDPQLYAEAYQAVVEAYPHDR